MTNNVALRDKIIEMYPEIGMHQLSVEVAFDKVKNAYGVTLAGAGRKLSTYLEKSDADECLEGAKCVYLGVQIAQFIRNFDEREVFGRTAA